MDPSKITVFHDGTAGTDWAKAPIRPGPPGTPTVDHHTRVTVPCQRGGGGTTHALGAPGPAGGGGGGEVRP